MTSGFLLFASPRGVGPHRSFLLGSCWRARKKSADLDPISQCRLRYQEAGRMCVVLIITVPKSTTVLEERISFPGASSRCQIPIDQYSKVCYLICATRVFSPDRRRSSYDGSYIGTLSHSGLGTYRDFGTFYVSSYKHCRGATKVPQLYGV